MDSIENYVLSEVHMQTTVDTSKQKNIARFFFSLKSNSTCHSPHHHASDTNTTDEDGDIIIPSRQKHLEVDKRLETDCLPLACSMENNNDNTESVQDQTSEVIIIEHKLQTVLKEVGYQVWLGSLLMCDYLMDYGENLTHHIVLDLGAGTGLTSIVAAMYAKSVICTDYSQEIISLAESNWNRNFEILPGLSSKEKVKFQLLDWTKHQLDSAATDIDVQNLYDATLILAAEVVYDDNLTDAFFQTIYFLLRKPPRKTLIMAVEKRIVFDARWQDVCCPAYEHFQANLKDLCTVDEGSVRFSCLQIPTQDIQQYFVYKRTVQLELWKITSHFHESSSDGGNGAN